MARKWILKILGAKEDDSAEMLELLARHRTPVQVELEGSLLRFKSVITLRDKAVVLAKPPTLNDAIRKGLHIRLRWPGAGRREMRLQVAAPHFNLSNGSAAFLCKPPDGTSMPKRKHERFDTSRFTNLRLEVDGDSFRVLDLSVAGCRIAMTAGAGKGSFVVGGKPSTEALLIVGKDSKVVLERIVPRSRRQDFVGCEFTVKQDGKSPKVLADVIKSVQGQHDTMARTG